MVRLPGIPMVLLKSLARCALLASLLSGCAATGVPFEEILDPGTGVTITRSGRPVVLYRESAGRAAYARDFVYLGPLGVNRMGDHHYYLWLGIWSTLSTGVPGEERDGFESVTLFADGEPMQLPLAGWTADSIGASRDVYQKPVASAADAYYEVTLDQLRFIAGARSLRLLASGPTAPTYELWSRNDTALQAFGSLVAVLER